MDRQQRHDWRDRLMREMRDGTPRFQRAERFARQVMHLMGEFIPSDRECLRRIDEALLLDAFRADIEIVNVPPERDADMAAKLKAAAVTLQPMIVPKTTNDGGPQ